MFVHLHNHTHYSLLDGLTRPKETVKIAREQGSSAVAITDHGVLYGAIEFYKAAKEEGINPIIGCEIYVAPLGRLNKEPGTPINHLTVLAQTTEGYKNLLQLVSKAHLEGFYYKPRVDHGLLREFGKGLIALSGCLAGEVAEAITQNDEEKAAEVIRRYQDIFGSENFFLEVMDHLELPDQLRLNEALYRLSRELKAPLVATNDNHYGRKEDRDPHDILLCIQTGKTVADKNRMHYDGDYSMRSPEEMKAAFKGHPEAISNTVEIAQRCRVEIDFGTNLLPHFTPPEELSQEDYLKKLCGEGLKARYGTSITNEMRERLAYELSVIHKAGFDAYFLIVCDFIDYAKRRGVIVGPGRGSAAGSLVAYVLRITDIDPLRYGLLFERFLNPARVSMPDIDIDFDDERRNEVLAYVIEKYGRNNVAQIITFGTMAARAAVRDVGRAMGYPYDEVDRLAKLVPPPVQGKHLPLKTSIKDDFSLKKAYESDQRARALLDNAIRLEGTVRHAGTHACAVVISEKNLTEYAPLQNATGDSDGVITQYSMKPLEDLGLLKVDFLGLKNLTIIRNTLAAIERLHEKHIDLHVIPLDDRKTFALLAAGETTGVFQLESGGMRRYLRELKPSAFNDIIAMVSLYRPGPMRWIPMYIKGKHDAASVHYIHPSFESILKETYGVAVYQEQILFLARQFAGFSLGEADILRKAVGKKDPKLLAGEREKFIAGAVGLGHAKKFAQEVFEKVIEPFAAYGFNKSHATCYAMIAYQTAYLKAHYPAEFMAALLTADSSNEERIALEVNECNSMGIAVLLPSINESLADFTVIDASEIRFGLKAIKGVGEATIQSIIGARVAPSKPAKPDLEPPPLTRPDKSGLAITGVGESGGPFRNLEDFCRRIPFSFLNKKLIEALAYSGAIDDLGERKAIAASCDVISAFAKTAQTAAADGQTDIFGMMEPQAAGPCALTLKKIAPATRLEKLQWEKHFLGLFVSGHPLQGLKKYLAKKAMPVSKINESLVGKPIILCGVLSRVRRVVTKSGAAMAYGEFEDLTGRIETIAFPRVYEQCAAAFTEGQVVLVEGRLDVRNELFQCVVNKCAEVSLESMIAHAKKEKLFDEKEPFMVLSATRIQPEKKKNQQTGPFTISISDKMDAASLEMLKTLLSANRGQQAVQLKVVTGGEARMIKVPFGIDLTRELKEQIASLVK